MSEKIKHLNGFITTNNGSDGILHKQGLLFNNKFDEPTYVSIRIDFFPDIIDKRYITPANVAEQKSLENVLSKTDYNTMPCPLLDMDGDYSTFKYLKDSIGDIHRAKLLEKLIHGLTDLSAFCPYYITSVDGINNLLTVDPKRGTRVKSDTVITLKCMEGLDQRISAIKNMYKKIAWDDVYQRWILPDMMRFFKMYIYITEFRVFHTHNTYAYTNESLPEWAQGVANNISSSSNNKRILRNMFSKKSLEIGKYDDYKFLNSRMPTTVLECSMCEFDISDSFSHLSSLSSSPKNNNLDNLEIKIKVGNIKENSLYGLFGREIHNNTETDAYKNVISLNDIKLSKQNRTFDDDNEKQRLIDEANINYYLRVSKALEDEYVKPDPLPNSLDNINPTIKSTAAPTLEDAHSTYFGRLLKNTAKSALGWAKNHIKDQVINLINKKIVGGSSLYDVRRALQTENIFSMINIFKANAENIKTAYPEVSAATSEKNKKMELELFKEHLNTLSQSTDDSVAKHVADYLITYGNENNLNNLDDYTNALKDLLKDVEVSKATMPVENKKMLL